MLTCQVDCCVAKTEENEQLKQVLVAKMAGIQTSAQIILEGSHKNHQLPLARDSHIKITRNGSWITVNLFEKPQAITAGEI
jgi:hypothetical protein